MNEVLFSHNVARQVPFDEAKFAWSRGSGSGVVRGQACLYKSDSSRLNVSHIKAELFPMTSYTTAMIQREYVNGVNLAAPDRRLAKYVRSTTTDGDGDFQFSGIPAGQYYVGFRYSISSTEPVGNDGRTHSELHYRRLYARVTVKNGRVSTMEDWIGGIE